jgi:hypothetical protein
VAGSNNSRNAPWEERITSALLMNDAGQRFAIDPTPMYTAGASGTDDFRRTLLDPDVRKVSHQAGEKF